jgi:DNA-binding transcriptional MocR family regulator
VVLFFRVALWHNNDRGKLAMYHDLKLNGNRPVYLQIKDYLKQLILNGILQAGSRLPSTRELSIILKVSRNTITQGYQYLEDDGFIHNVKGQGAFVAKVEVQLGKELQLNWPDLMTGYARKAVELDIEKNELRWEKGLISFKSIAPDESLFEMAEFKKAFVNRISFHGEKLLNYGYAKGYKPLIEYLMFYMKNKGVNSQGKDILITNGFKVYKERHEIAIELAKRYIPHRKIWGEGGLHIFIELNGINARELLADCYRKGVVFLPGDVFYTDNGGTNTFRLGISRVTPAAMEQGFKIIGEIIRMRRRDL